MKSRCGSLSPSSFYCKLTHTLTTTRAVSVDDEWQLIKPSYEELIANKQRVKTGEVAVSKHIETETARVSVPIEKSEL